MSEPSGIDAKLDLILAEQARMAAEQARMTAEQARMRSDFTDLRTALMDRMDRLQDALTVQKDDMIVPMSAAERAERIAKAAQDDARTLGEMVMPMMRQIRRLQEDVRALKGEP